MPIQTGWQRRDKSNRFLVGERHDGTVDRQTGRAARVFPRRRHEANEKLRVWISTKTFL